MSYANPTSTTDYIDALNWGTATGAETTSTLYTARLDSRIPPDQYHSSGLQITRYGELLLSMSQYFAGGNRVRMRTNSSNQFAVGEYGIQISTTKLQVSFNGGTLETVLTGTGSQTLGGHLLFSPDNTYDIGAAGATRPRTAYLGTSLVSPSVGPAAGQQHTLPAVASDTVALLAASQSLSNKTIAGATVTGALLFSLDNTIDIGAAGATRPRTVYVGTSLVVPTVGPSAGQQHSLPATASDTLALLAASQTLTNKILGATTMTGALTIANQSDAIKTGAASFQTTSGQAAASGAAYKFDTTNSYTVATEFAFWFVNAGTAVFKMGAIGGTSGFRFSAHNSSGGAQLAYMDLGQSGLRVSTGGIGPVTDNTGSNGTSSLRWNGTFSRYYVGQTQTVSGTATTTIDSDLGDNIIVNLADGTNVTSWNITNGAAGKWVMVTWVQPGTGVGVTLAGANSAIKFLPSTYLGTDHVAPTLTTANNKRDSHSFRHDGTNWIEVSRNFNN